MINWGSLAFIKYLPGGQQTVILTYYCNEKAKIRVNMNKQDKVTTLNLS